MILKAKLDTIRIMEFIALICSARFWLSIIVSTTLGIGGATADIHPIDAEEIACMTASIEAHNTERRDVEKNNGEQRPAHKHHTHNCGPCHLHMVGMTGLSFTHDVPASQRLRPGANQHIPRAGPQGLYRPPRA